MAKLTKSDQAVKETITQINKASLDTPHISELCGVLVKEFGGLEAFSKHMVTGALTAPPGSKTQLDWFKAVGNIILYSTQNRGTAPDVIAMSDLEIKQEKIKLLMEMINSDDADADGIKELLTDYQMMLDEREPETIEATDAGGRTEG